MNTLKCQISTSQNEINSILQRITPIQFDSNTSFMASSAVACNGMLNICSDVDISGTEYVNNLVNRGDYTGTNVFLDGDLSLTGTLAATSNNISIGYQSGLMGQKANTVAIGNYAGNLNQQTHSIAVGSYAGYERQDADAIAIGHQAGYSDQQASIAIGANAGYDNQAYYAIAIGRNSGNINQGSNSIAIGYQAGPNSQHTNTTILNASGSVLNSDGANRLYMAPIRGVAAGKGVDVLCYNPITHEIYYSTT